MLLHKYDLIKNLVKSPLKKNITINAGRQLPLIKVVQIKRLQRLYF